MLDTTTENLVLLGEDIKLEEEALGTGLLQSLQESTYQALLLISTPFSQLFGHTTNTEQNKYYSSLDDITEATNEIGNDRGIRNYPENTDKENI